MAVLGGAGSGGKPFPPGFRFHPTDEEIVNHYLKNKVFGRKHEVEVIREIDLYKCEPWDLPEKSILSTRDPEWYFFCPRDKKYPNGSRSNRATEKGYWKATGKDRKVNSQSVKIGMKKTLVFYKGRAPQGERTNWLMHEYRLDETQCKGAPHLQDLYVICRVFQKGRVVSKDGEQNGMLEQSEERSFQEMQGDDSPNLPSETSSEILDNKEDNVCQDGSVESSQGKSNPDCGVVSPDITVLNNNLTACQAEDDAEIQALLYESVSLFNIDLPQLYPDSTPAADSFLFENTQTYEEDTLGYPFLDESYENMLAGTINNEIFPADSNDVIPYNDVCVQIRPRPTSWPSNQQLLPCQGTASRRIRLQCKDSDNDDSEVVTEQEESGLTSLSSQTCSLEEDDAGSDIFSTVESSFGSEKSVNSTGSEEKSALVEESDSMSSSECIESSCAQPGPLIANVLQDNNENPQEQFNNSVSSNVVIPVTREQAMLRKSKHVEKCDVTTSTRNVLEGDMALVEEGMESHAKINSKRGSMVSDAAAGFDSVQVKATGSQSVTMQKNGIKCKESVKHTGFRLILRSLKLRGKSGSKDTVFVCEKESTDVIKRPSYDSKECSTGFVNSGKALSIFLVTGLLVTAGLVCFTWSYGN